MHSMSGTNRQEEALLLVTNHHEECARVGVGVTDKPEQRVPEICKCHQCRTSAFLL